MINSNRPLTPTPSLQHIPSTPTLTPPTEVTPKKPLQDLPSESTLPKAPLLGSETEGQTIRNKVDDIPTTTILEESTTAPKPRLLVQSLEKVESSKTPTTPSETPKAPEKPYEPSDLVSPSVSEANTKFVKTVLNVSKSKDLSLFIANNLKTSMDRLRKADSGLVGRQQKIDTELAQARLDAEALLQSIGSNSDTSFLLKGKSDDELKALVRDSVQKMMGYSDKEMDKLSDKKEQWIQSIVDGIKDGLVSQPPGEVKGEIARALDEVTSSAMQNIQSQDPLHPISVEMGMKTPNEIMDDVKKALGHTRPEVYEAMVKGIQQGLPKILDMDRDTDRFTKIEFGGKTFEKVRSVGKGQCGEVMLMEDKETGKKYVLKGLDRFKDFKQEIENQIEARKTMGDSVLKIEGVFTHDPFVYTLTELAPGGELKDNFMGVDVTVKNGLVSNEFAQKMKLTMGIETALVLESFQKTGMQHNDIKPENFIRGVDGTLKLADFGESRSVGSDLPRATGTPGLMAPEVYDPNAQVTQKGDQFSYGVMLFQSMFNKHPFGEVGANELVTNVEKYGRGEFQIDMSHIENPALKGLFEDLLNVDPNKRPGFDVVAQSLKDILGAPLDSKQVTEFQKATSDYDKAIKTFEKGLDEELDKTGFPLGQIENRVAKFEADIRYYLKPENTNPVELEKCRTSLKEWTDRLEERTTTRNQRISEFLQTEPMQTLGAKVSYWTNPSTD